MADDILANCNPFPDESDDYARNRREFDAMPAEKIAHMLAAPGASEAAKIAALREEAKHYDQRPARAQSEQAQQPVANQPTRQVPAPLGEAAYYGLPGLFTRLIAPGTEADPAALLFQFMVAVGSIIGRGPNYFIEASNHYTNLYVAIVGDSAKARKGTAWGHVHAACKLIDPTWWGRRISGGLSTGEGVIHAVRDERREDVIIKENHHVVGVEEQITDAGEKDKRLLCVESELARTLQAGARDGNTLISLLRDAWDGRPLRSLTKNAKESCLEPHFSMIGHVTIVELLRVLTVSEAFNGFANRFIWVYSTRSKCLPFGGKVDEATRILICERVRDAVAFARGVDQIAWAPDAARRWEDVYPKISEGKKDLFGTITARAEAQVMRLALLSALLDKSAEIHLEHLEAALELWRYSSESAAFIWGCSLGDPLADAILEVLRSHPEGMTRTELNDHFTHNKTKADLDAAIAAAQRSGSLRIEKRDTAGRPAEILHAVSV